MTEKFNVMYVDDDPQDIYMFHENLKLFPCKIAVFDDVMKALCATIDTRFDFGVFDYCFGRHFLHEVADRFIDKVDRFFVLTNLSEADLFGRMSCCKIDYKYISKRHLYGCCLASKMGISL